MEVIENMSTTIDLEQIHTFARNCILRFTGIEYIILFTANEMKSLVATTNRSNLIVDAPEPKQIIIEDPYFVPKGPIFDTKQIAGVPAPPPAESQNLEEEFNTGSLTRDLFTLIRSLSNPDEEDELTDAQEIATLRKIKLYTDHTSALFIQTLLSYVILYPEKFLALKNLDNQSRLVTIQKKLTEQYRDISNAESEIITDFILLIIDTLASPLDDPDNPDKIMKLLNELDRKAIPPNNTHNWLNKSFTVEQIINLTKIVDLFQRLFNTMNIDLICGIPRESARLTKETNAIVNDLLRVSIDVQIMEKIRHTWKYLLASENVTPVIISFLKDELPRIFGYFEEADPLPDGEPHIDISRVVVKEYLDTFLKQNIIAKLTELSGQPSSEATLKIFRSLQIFRYQENGEAKEKILPDPNIINFLFTVTFILQEYPALSTLHQRSELFEHGPQPSTHPSSVRILNSQQIFPGIISRYGRTQLLESVELEHEYNRLKNEITDLDLRIGQVGQLQNLLKTARGIPL